MVDDRFSHALFPQVYANERNFQVLLGNSIKTLTMLAAVASVAVLLLSARQEIATDQENEAEQEHVRGAKRSPVSAPAS